MHNKPLRTAIALALAALVVKPTCGQIDANASVLTQHNNPQRNGVFSHETSLMPDTVRNRPNSFNNFERLCIRKVDARVMAQPLYVSNVMVRGRPRNIVIVVTANNSIYAFDADNVDPLDTKNGMAWPAPRTLERTENETSAKTILHAEPLAEDPPCNQTKGPVGIIGTPVVDATSGMLYLVARFAHPRFVPGPDGKVRSDAGFGKSVYYDLIKIDITTGDEKRRQLIAGHGFQAYAELNRPGLLLMNGVIYVGFGAPVCDAAEGTVQHPGGRPGTHGFVFAYSAGDLHLIDAYNTSPNSSLAGIWQSGAGLAGDVQRNFVFALTGNNGDSDFVHFEQTGVGSNSPDDLYHPMRTELGESILKLQLVSNRFQCIAGPNGCVTEHFTAGNWYRLDTGYHGPLIVETGPDGKPVKKRLDIDVDLRHRCALDFQALPPDKRQNLDEGKVCDFGGDSDLGSGGPVVLSNGYVLGGGKQGRIYILNPFDPNDSNAIRYPKQTFQAGLNTWHPNTGAKRCTFQDPTLQPGCSMVPNDDYDFFQDWGPNIHGAPVVWQPQTKDFGYVYLMAEKDYLRAYKIYKDGHVDPNPSRSTASTVVFDIGLRSAFGATLGSPRFDGSSSFKLRSPDGMPGGALSLSSNGDSSAIIWVSVSPEPSTYGVHRGVLIALDANDLGYLWSDADPKISFAKFVPPTIAGGKVFRATFGDGYSDSVCDPQANAAGNQSCGSLVIYGINRRIKVRRVR